MESTRTQGAVASEDEFARVLHWRHAERRRRFGDAESTALAARLEIDLHGALKLVSNGWPPVTASRTSFDRYRNRKAARAAAPRAIAFVAALALAATTLTQRGTSTKHARLETRRAKRAGELAAA